MAGELLYYLREVPIPLYVWATGPTPKNHYEMTRPFTAASPEPVLFVSLKRCPPRLGAKFGSFTELGTVSVPVVKEKRRSLYFCRLADYRPLSDAGAPPQGRSR